MPDSQRPSIEQLIDWIEGRLTGVEAKLVADRVAASGDDVETDVEWLRAFTRASSEVILDEPPEDVHKTLHELFARYAQGKRTSQPQDGVQPDHAQPGVWRQLTAALAFDSSQQPAMAGTRAAQPAASRQLIYTTQVAEIALTIQPTGRHDGCAIRGQILPRQDLQPNAFTVHVLHDNAEVGMVRADEFGEFELEALGTGQYQMILTAAPLTIVLNSLFL